MTERLTDQLRADLDAIARVNGETLEIPASMTLNGQHLDIAGGPNPRHPKHMTDDDLQKRLDELQKQPDAATDARIAQIQSEMAERASRGDPHADSKT